MKQDGSLWGMGYGGYKAMGERIGNNHVRSPPLLNHPVWLLHWTYVKPLCQSQWFGLGQVCIVLKNFDMKVMIMKNCLKALFKSGFEKS